MSKAKSSIEIFQSRFGGYDVRCDLPEVGRFTVPFHQHDRPTNAEIVAAVRDEVTRRSSAVLRNKAYFKC